jgi:hypothetical protein
MIPPHLNADFRDMLSALNDAGSEWLLIGGYAVIAHGYPRLTKDIDLWVRPSRENAARVLRALVAFGAPSHGITVDDLSRPGTVLQIGVPPSRIDLVTEAEALTFDGAWANRVTREIDGVRVNILALDDLLANERAVGRPSDLADVESLELRRRQAGRPPD